VAIGDHHFLEHGGGGGRRGLRVGHARAGREDGGGKGRQMVSAAVHVGFPWCRWSAVAAAQDPAMSAVQAGRGWRAAPWRGTRSQRRRAARRRSAGRLVASRRSSWLAGKGMGADVLAGQACDREAAG